MKKKPQFLDSVVFFGFPAAGPSHVEGSPHDAKLVQNTSTLISGYPLVSKPVDTPLIHALFFVAKNVFA